MQNKPNLPAPQMNVSSILTKDYENKSNWKLGENKANTKPIKANTRNVQIAVNLVNTTTNNNEPRTMNYSKQTQSNPTCSELVEPISRQAEKGFTCSGYGFCEI
ncbi:unnamed protein product, partial [marine sediment metagenome]